MNTGSVVLQAVPPFDFAASLRFMRGFAPAAGEQAVTGDAFTRALRAEGRTVVVHVTAEGAAALRCDLHAEAPLPPEAVDAAADRVAFQLSLDDDLSEFYALGREDPCFAPVVERLHGYHQVKFPSPLEAVVWSILSQRTAMTVAANEKRALSEHVGNTVNALGAVHAAFPDIEQLAAIPPGRVAELIGNQRKGRYLAGALRGWLDADEDFLRTGPYEEVKDFLLTLPGVGPWAAAFVLLRGLGRTLETPAEKQLSDPAARVYERPLSREQIQRIGDGYGPWQGYWAHYLRVAG